MTRATVLIPSHDHGALLGLAAASALAQSVADLEVFIVLDGADPETAAAARSLADDDSRVQVFVNPKGERHGEAHRHRALEEARGRIIYYLSDDDLWFPDHVEYLEGLLEDADFAHSLPAVVGSDGALRTPHVGDLTDPSHRELITRGRNFIPLSTAAHTLAAYRSLPEGWTPAPAGLPTDLHMWQKFVAAPEVRLTSGGRPTVLRFPTPARIDMGLDERLSELTSWRERIGDAEGRASIRLAVFESLASETATHRARSLRLESLLEQARHDLDESKEALANTRSELEELVEIGRRKAELEAELAQTHDRQSELEDRLAAIQGSIAYRASRRLARVPVVRSIGRWVGRALAGRGDR